MTKPACEDTFLIKKRNLKNNYFSFTFGPYSRTAQCRPGRFVHIRLPSSDVYFRRAMSVAAADPDRQQIEIIFKVLGRGTELLSGYHKHARVDILGPLGNTFTFPRRNEKTIIIAGGVGFPPLLYFASEMAGKGYNPKNIEFFYGGRTAGEIVERARMRGLGVNFRPVTDDGSYGYRGLVSEAVEEYIQEHVGERMRLYGCGPEAMLSVIDEIGMRNNLPGQLSLEAPMPCGIGVCLGCVVPLRKGGHARVCRDGPVFDIGEVLL